MLAEYKTPRSGHASDADITVQSWEGILGWEQKKTLPTTDENGLPFYPD